jgi:hypothetical protein
VGHPEVFSSCYHFQRYLCQESAIMFHKRVSHLFSWLTN